MNTLTRSFGPAGKTPNTILNFFFTQIHDFDILRFVTGQEAVEQAAAAWPRGEAVVEAGKQRIRPCLMTTATTVLALIPVLTSTGRGSDVMVPMAIPSFGGMCLELITMFVVPVCYATVREFLEQGSEVELGDLFSLAVEGGPEIREDESGGFSA